MSQFVGKLDIFPKDLHTILTHLSRHLLNNVKKPDDLFGEGFPNKLCQLAASISAREQYYGCEAN